MAMNTPLNVETGENLGKIQDLGEISTLAKKDKYALGLISMDLSDQDTRALPLSKLFPVKELDNFYKDTYERILAESNDKELAESTAKTVTALITTMRDDIPNKPRKERAVQRWFNHLEQVKQSAIALQSWDSKTINEFVETGVEKGTAGMAKAYVMSKTERSDWGLIKEAYITNVYQEENGYKPHFVYNIGDKKEWEQLQGKLVIDGAGYRLVDDDGNRQNKKAVIDNFIPNIEKAIAQAKEATKTADTEKDRPKNYDYKLYSRYSVQENEKPYYIALAKNKNIILKEFDTQQSMRDFYTNNRQELDDLATTYIENHNVHKGFMRRDTNQERVSEDYRQGRDVTAQELADTFGLKAIEFGNWLNQAERQTMLNNAYDSFTDLSRAINIPPNGIGLDKSLSVAFGSRGGGNYSAHYERAGVVINLTKTKGAGALAHEWLHALDNYLAQDKGGYISRLNQGKFDKEVIQSAVELISEIKKSDFNKRSITADFFRSDGYYQSNIELMARAFETHVINKLEKQGFANDFLANMVKEEDWRLAPEVYIYPKKEEVQALEPFFDKLIEKWKEHDKSIDNSKDYGFTAKEQTQDIQNEPITMTQETKEQEPVEPVPDAKEVSQDVEQAFEKAVNVMRDLNMDEQDIKAYTENLPKLTGTQSEIEYTVGLNVSEDIKGKMIGADEQEIARLEKLHADFVNQYANTFSDKEAGQVFLKAMSEKSELEKLTEAVKQLNPSQTVEAPTQTVETAEVITQAQAEQDKANIERFMQEFKTAHPNLDNSLMTLAINHREQDGKNTLEIQGMTVSSNIYGKDNDKNNIYLVNVSMSYDEKGELENGYSFSVMNVGKGTVLTRSEYDDLDKALDRLDVQIETTLDEKYKANQAVKDTQTVTRFAEKLNQLHAKNEVDTKIVATPIVGETGKIEKLSLSADYEIDGKPYSLIAENTYDQTGNATGSWQLKVTGDDKEVVIADDMATKSLISAFIHEDYAIQQGTFIERHSELQQAKSEVEPTFEPDYDDLEDELEAQRQADYDTYLNGDEPKAGEIEPNITQQLEEFNERVNQLNYDHKNIITENDSKILITVEHPLKDTTEKEIYNNYTHLVGMKDETNPELVNRWHIVDGLNEHIHTAKDLEEAFKYVERDLKLSHHSMYGVADFHEYKKSLEALPNQPTKDPNFDIRDIAKMGKQQSQEHKGNTIHHEQLQQLLEKVNELPYDSKTSLRENNKEIAFTAEYLQRTTPRTIEVVGLRDENQEINSWHIQNEWGERQHTAKDLDEAFKHVERELQLADTMTKDGVMAYAKLKMELHEKEPLEQNPDFSDKYGNSEKAVAVDEPQKTEASYDKQHDELVKDIQTKVENSLQQAGFSDETIAKYSDRVIQEANKTKDFNRFDEKMGYVVTNSIKKDEAIGIKENTPNREENIKKYHELVENYALSINNANFYDKQYNADKGEIPYRATPLDYNPVRDGLPQKGGLIKSIDNPFLDKDIQQTIKELEKYNGLAKFGTQYETLAKTNPKDQLNIEVISRDWLEQIQNKALSGEKLTDREIGMYKVAVQNINTLHDIRSKEPKPVVFNDLDPSKPTLVAKDMDNAIALHKTFNDKLNVVASPNMSLKDTLKTLSEQNPNGKFYALSERGNDSELSAIRNTHVLKQGFGGDIADIYKQYGEAGVKNIIKPQVVALREKQATIQTNKDDRGR